MTTEPKRLEDALHILPKLKVAEHLLNHTPETSLAFRPACGDGKFSYSFGEIYAHLADARNHFILRYIHGEDSVWMVEPPKTFPEGVWPLRAGITLTPNILREALRASFSLAAQSLEEPANILLQASRAGAEKFREDEERKNRGEFSLLKVIPLASPLRSDIFTMLLAHEWRHIGGLFAGLRQQGVNIPPM